MILTGTGDSSNLRGNTIIRAQVFQAVFKVLGVSEVSEVLGVLGVLGILGVVL
jgi:hypothetical protein